MTNSITLNLIERRIKELRPIKISSKRQVTIPKSIFDLLKLKEGDSLIVYALDDKILLEPSRTKESVYALDRRAIISQAISEGYRGEELADEIDFRLKEYDDFLARRIKQFDADIAETETNHLPVDVAGDDDVNGLNVFFNQETGTSPEKT